MLDIFINWFVVAVPFLVTVGATVLALRLPHERHYWKFVGAALCVGLIFSGITYWQQVRAARQAGSDRENAIKETAKQVAAETTRNVTAAVGEQYRHLIESLTGQIGDLKGQLARQGKKVDAIGSSDIVTGRNPVKVQVAGIGHPLDVGAVANVMKGCPEVQIVIKGKDGEFQKSLASALSLVMPRTIDQGLVIDMADDFEGMKIYANDAPISADDKSAYCAKALVAELKRQNFTATYFSSKEYHTGKKFDSNFVRIVFGVRD